MTKERAASWGSDEAAERIEIAPRSYAFVRLHAGEAVRVVDIDGGQVADLFAWSAAGDGEHLSAQHTRAKLDRLFPEVGEDFYTDRRRPILTYERDDSPGVHDLLIAATANVHNVPLLTKNAQDFALIADLVEAREPPVE